MLKIHKIRDRLGALFPIEISLYLMMKKCTEENDKKLGILGGIKK
jgi:hypothetical protein